MEKISVKGKWFEEFEVGQKFFRSGITLSETHVLLYGFLTGDTGPLHVNEEYAKTTKFGKRLVQGMLIASMALPEEPFIQGTAVAREGDTFRYRAPVFIGDTITTEFEVIKTERKEKFGRVTFKITTKNQRGEVVLEGEHIGLIAFRPK